MFFFWLKRKKRKEIDKGIVVLMRWFHKLSPIRPLLCAARYFFSLKECANRMKRIRRHFFQFYSKEYNFYIRVKNKALTRRRALSAAAKA